MVEAYREANQSPRLQKIMFNSAQHEISDTHRYKNLNYLAFFEAQITLDAFFAAHKC